MFVGFGNTDDCRHCLGEGRLYRRIYNCGGGFVRDGGSFRCDYCGGTGRVSAIDAARKTFQRRIIRRELRTLE